MIFMKNLHLVDFDCMVYILHDTGTHVSARKKAMFCLIFDLLLQFAVLNIKEDAIYLLFIRYMYTYFIVWRKWHCSILFVAIYSL
jgi:hypothetical protein